MPSVKLVVGAVTGQSGSTTMSNEAAGPANEPVSIDVLAFTVSVLPVIVTPAVGASDIAVTQNVLVLVPLPNTTL